MVNSGKVSDTMGEACVPMDREIAGEKQLIPESKLNSVLDLTHLTGLLLNSNHNVADDNQPRQYLSR